MNRRLSLLCAAMLLCAPALAEPQSVEVKGLRNPELKNYRAMLAGLDSFEANHAFAPAAPEVRFWLRPRTDLKTIDTENLTLTIRGDSVSLPVPIGPGLEFSVPRDAAAEAENADMELNKPKGGYRWHPDVRSAGVPEGMRRLGDLRLECRVLVDVAKVEIGTMMKLFINSILLTTDWCGHHWMKMPTPTRQKVESATLLLGEQRIPLEVDKNGRAFTPPLHDQQYPDDALIEVRYAGE